jgi:hypothetical protein
MVATGLIAVGFGFLRLTGSKNMSLPVALWLWFHAGALIGFGALLPFRRPWFGLCAGLVVKAAILTYIGVKCQIPSGPTPLSPRAVAAMLAPRPGNANQK